jgi:hypothetical protein
MVDRQTLAYRSSAVVEAASQKHNGTNIPEAFGRKGPVVRSEAERRLLTLGELCPHVDSRLTQSEPPLRRKQPLAPW